MLAESRAWGCERRVCIAARHSNRLRRWRWLSRFRYAQSKIDLAPDTILVDHEVVAIIEDQQQWTATSSPPPDRATCSPSGSATCPAQNRMPPAPTTASCTSLIPLAEQDAEVEHRIRVAGVGRPAPLPLGRPHLPLLPELVYEAGHGVQAVGVGGPAPPGFGSASSGIHYSTLGQ
jgi:hypothetical protein